ncbi:winged helix-turn-helix transcriptional regulator [Pandoraea sp. NPDC090278]|uniref:winged helix-turn-helix transcriptional regulator n=1 Tax=Pandoraea sp. NPDC090278 TaxID=3364391 RepID=UPI00383A2CE8
MKGKKTDLGGENCGIARALDVIGDWWSLLIVREAFAGRQRFNEFQKSLGAAKNILSARLKKLVEQGILTIEPGEGARVSHRYVLTPKGEQLGVVLIALWQWGEEACFAPGELQSAMVDNETGRPVAKLELLSQDGRAIGPRGFHLARKDVQSATEQ